jgi:hypothetical protein
MQCAVRPRKLASGLTPKRHYPTCKALEISAREGALASQQLEATRRRLEGATASMASMAEAHRHTVQVRLPAGCECLPTNHLSKLAGTRQMP